MRRPAEYFWAVAELAPGVPKTPGAQAVLEHQITRFTQGVRWGRALVSVPVLTAILTAQQAGATMPTYDYMAWVQRAKQWYDTQISTLIKEQADTARFITNAFVAYKSYTMLNSLAQRIRYGNVDFLVEMALPKLDFTTSRYRNDDIGTGVIEDTRTQISFVPSNSQTQDNLGWLIRYGGPQIAAQLQRQPASLAQIGRKVLEQMKSALLNPEGDVTITSLDLDSGTILNVRSPEVWVQLANADAMAAWIFSQNRHGLGSAHYDNATVIQAVREKERLDRSAEAQSAYQRLLEFQQQAAATGENLYNNQEYLSVLNEYYMAAHQDNLRRQKESIAPQDTETRLRLIDEEAKANQEVVGGMKMAILAQSNRTEAVNENLKEIGRTYKSIPVPKGMSLGDFLGKNPGESMSAQMGVLLKLLQVEQASQQTQGEILKLLAQLQAKQAIKELDAAATKKAGEVKQAMAASPKSAAAAAKEDYQKAETAATAAIPALMGVQNILVIPGVQGRDGSKGPTKIVRFKAGEDPSNEVRNARKALLGSTRERLKDEVDRSRKELANGLSSATIGGQGFLSQALFAFTGAVRMAFGGEFDLKTEAEKWRSAGEMLASKQRDAKDLSTLATDTGLTEAEQQPLGTDQYLDSLDPTIQKALVEDENPTPPSAPPPMPPATPATPPASTVAPASLRQDSSSN